MSAYSPSPGSKVSLVVLLLTYSYKYETIHYLSFNHTRDMVGIRYDSCTSSKPFSISVINSTDFSSSDAGFGNRQFYYQASYASLAAKGAAQ